MMVMQSGATSKSPQATTELAVLCVYVCACMGVYLHLTSVRRKCE